MNDKKIIQSIRQRDEEVIGYLMLKYSRLLWKIASDILFQIGSDADTEEVIADVFISIWQNPAAFDTNRGTLKNYLCLLCRSKAVDRFRILSRNAAVDIDALSAADTVSVTDLLSIADARDPEQILIRNEEMQLLSEAIQSLSEEEQDVIIRRFLYDQKPKVIAKATGLNVRRVENIVYRSKIKIRDFIKKEETNNYE